MMGSKLGLAEAKKEDEKLITDLLDWMHQNEADYTNTFRDLSQEELPCGALYATENFQAWQTRWQERLGAEDPECSLALRKSVNPSVIPRNHKVEEALQAGEKGDLEPFRQLLRALINPYEDGITLRPTNPLRNRKKRSSGFAGPNQA